jgi:hypothetical protein
MSPRELEVLARHFVKANPPPVLYRYRRATDWTLKELAVPEVHVTCVHDMNDPFEYRAPLHVDLEKLRNAFRGHAITRLGMTPAAAKKAADAIGEIELDHVRERLNGLGAASGLVCATRDALSNRMWAYYGDGHRGICVGYATVDPPFCLARAVLYADPDVTLDLLDVLARDPTLLSDHVSCRKGAEWAFEQEYRIPIGPFPQGHTRLLPIVPKLIVEIRLGVKIDPGFRARILEIVRSHLPHARVLQVGCDNRSFRLTEAVVQADVT